MKKKKKHTHTTVQQWPGAYLLHIVIRLRRSQAGAQNRHQGYF